jgi:hypothetical protein
VREISPFFIYVIFIVKKKMKNIYLLSENQVDLIAQKTKQQMEMSNFKKVFGTLFNELNIQKGVHIRNMKKMNESERQEYLEEMMDNYVLDIFPRTNFIHEQFDNNFTNNMLLESSNHSFRTLYNFFDFLKSSVLYECGFLNTRNFNISLNEQGFLDSVGNAINKGYQTLKTGVQKGVEIGKKVVKAVTPYVTKFLDSEFAKFVPGIQLAKVAYDANKIYQNWEKIKKMTFEDWAEEFRSFLNGTAGVIIQIVLALTGIGNIANWIANGLMLIYDVAYQGIGKGNWNWYNILTSAIALVATGAAAVLKPLGGVLKGVTAGSKIGPALSKSPQLFNKIAPFIKSMGAGIGKIMGWVMTAFTTLTAKFPLIGRFLKPIGGAVNKIKGFLDEVVSGFQTYFKKGALQNAPTVKNVKGALGGHAHFDTASIAKKLLATADKTLTKMVVGGITKMYYTIKAGDTLQTIISKFKPQGVTQEILKQLNYAHGLEIKPGNKLRLA